MMMDPAAAAAASASVAFQTQTPHQSLRLWAQTDPDAVAFKIQHDSSPDQFSDISVIDHEFSINTLGLQYDQLLYKNGILPGAIVSLWMSGFAYHHIVHFLALSRAGYIPHLCSTSLSSSDMLSVLIPKVGSWVIFYDSLDPILAENVANYAKRRRWPVPVVPMPMLPPNSGKKKEDLEDAVELRGFKRKPNDLAVVVHTSGTVEGTPLPVEYTFRCLQKAANKWIIRDKYHARVQPIRGEVILAGYTMMHIAGLTNLLVVTNNRHCLFLPSHRHSRLPSPRHLPSLINQHRITRLMVFSPALMMYLQAAREDNVLLNTLRNLRVINFGGAELRSEVARWLYEQRLPVVNTYGVTQMGSLMASRMGQRCDILHPIAGVEFQLRDLPSSSSSESLVELIARPTGPACPTASFLDSDGWFHTRDIFERVSAPTGSSRDVNGHTSSGSAGGGDGGGFVWRERMDDFIKLSDGMHVDAKLLENEIHRACSDVLLSCVVVGHNRPYPALLAEPLNSRLSSTNAHELRKEIFKRLMNLHARRNEQERINFLELICILPPGRTLPRTGTKGNIRRGVVHREFKDVMDSMYASVLLNER